MADIRFDSMGSIDLNCVEDCSRPVAFRWRVGDQFVTAYGNGSTMTISKRQLIELANNLKKIIGDLT